MFSDFVSTILTQITIYSQSDFINNVKMILNPISKVFDMNRKNILKIFKCQVLNFIKIN